MCYKRFSLVSLSIISLIWGVTMVIVAPMLDLIFLALSIVWISPFVIFISGGLAALGFFYPLSVSQKKIAIAMLVINLIYAVLVGLFYFLVLPGLMSGMFIFL